MGEKNSTAKTTRGAKVDSVQKEPSLRDRVINGYEKLAFGGIEDAVKLIYADEISQRTIKNLDLMCVSEIKRQKDGSIDIKLYDRFEALKILAELEAERDDTGDFLKALEDGAKALRGEDD